jgi:hypothetical protein
VYLPKSTKDYIFDTTLASLSNDGFKLGKGSGGAKRLTRPQALTKAVEEIIMNMDRYHLWWSGHEETSTFKPATW